MGFLGVSFEISEWSMIEFSDFFVVLIIRLMVVVVVR